MRKIEKKVTTTKKNKKKSVRKYTKKKTSVAAGKDNLFFKMKDADGRMLMEGDTVVLLSNGMELVDMDTLEDVTGVISKFDEESGHALVNGQEYTSNEMRRYTV
jgi:hypothetical protein